MAKKAVFAVSVDGNDISADLTPVLISLKTEDKAGTVSDSCNIKVDDKDGQVAMPKVGALMSVSLGWSGGAVVEVFNGKVDSVKSTGGRGGRTLAISAKGLDTNSKAKEPRQKHHDKGKLPDVLKSFGADSDVSDVKVDQDFQGIERDYWAMDGESFIAFGQRIADEIGGTFRVRAGKAVLAKRGSGRSPGGQTMPTVTATWGVNLHSWDIAPQIGRPKSKKVKARFYDPKKATYTDVEADVTDDSDPAPVATHVRRHTVADKDEAASANSSDKSAAESNTASGSVVMEGDVTAHPEGECVVSGARPGIDGAYRIEGVSHSYDRSGFSTTLELNNKPGGVKKDSRKGKHKSKRSRTKAGKAAT